MRVDALQLIAFGPFTNITLDMSGGREGLHLVYGPNEAGKSSSLRALRQLLFGIPERSDDNFLHPYTKMRIGALLRTSDDKTLQVIRRKGRANTLRSSDDTTVLEETELKQFLQGVDADLFATMFGIDHQDLVIGGRDIIQGGGDLGRLVFSAGSGIADLRKIQTELQVEIESLFKPAAQKPKINASLGLLKINQKQLREAQLTGREWSCHDEALRSAETRKKVVDIETAQFQSRRNRLKRIDEALPLIARRRELRGELSDYIDAVPLPMAFPEKRRKLQFELENNTSQKTLAEKNVTALTLEINALDPSPALLENAELIEEFNRELGSQRKAAKDCISLDSRRNTLLSEAKELLRSLRDDLVIEQAEALRIKKTEMIKIRKLSTQYEGILNRFEDARDRMPLLDREIAEIDHALAQLPRPRSIETLRQALDEASEYGHQEKQYDNEQLEIDSAAEAIASEQSKMGLGDQNSETLGLKAVPSVETIRVFEKKFDSSDRALDEIEAETKKARFTLKEVERQIKAGRLEQEVPTEEDLRLARTLRDRGWQIIASTLAGQESSEQKTREFLTSVQGSETMSDAFELTMANADEISDRLRREADRVAVKAHLLTEKNSLMDQLQQLEIDRKAASNERACLNSEWTALWQQTGTIPRTPREMVEWVKDFQRLIEKVRSLQYRKAKTDTLGQQIKIHKHGLTKHLKMLGESEPGTEVSLKGMIKRVSKLIENEQTLFQTRTQLKRDKRLKEKERTDAAERLKKTEAELNNWRVHWQTAVLPIGLGADAHPDQAAAFMDELNSLFAKLKEAGILQKRMEGIEKDADQFLKKITGFIRVVAPDLCKRSSDEAALQLNRRLKRAREDAARKEALQKQLNTEKKILNKAKADISRIEAALKAMCQEARCTSPEDLAEAEQRSTQRRKLESDLKAIDDQLRHLSAGATIETFLQEAAAVNPDTIGSELSLLETAIERLEHEKSELDQTIGAERTELARMDGTSRAAALAEEIQITLGRLESDVEHFARLKIAAKVLAMAIERYRDKSQGPILKRTSELFRRITGGSFKGLRAEFDTAGKPVIVGVRSGTAELVSVDRMSDGTADQLYLALRLAGLEMYLEKNEPLPFVVDDILIRFDNQRAVSTLKVLAELSKKTQVIFFTHHHHLVDLAEQHIDPSILMKNTLNR